MRRVRRLVLGAAAGVVLGCSDKPAADECRGCPEVAEGGAVSFRDHVMPLFARSCNFQSCHGRETAARASLYLGPNMDTLEMSGIDAATLARVHDALLAPSATTGLPRIKPGDSANSFLMLKLDGCQASAEACTKQAGASVESGPCGELMPQRGPLLPCSERDVIRRFIAQGATNN